MHHFSLYPEVSLVDGNSVTVVKLTRFLPLWEWFVKIQQRSFSVCATVLMKLPFGPANLGLPKEEIVSALLKHWKALWH